MSQKIEPIGDVFCKGAIELGTGCKPCGRCAVALTARVQELEADIGIPIAKQNQAIATAEMLCADVIESAIEWFTDDGLMREVWIEGNRIFMGSNSASCVHSFAICVLVAAGDACQAQAVLGYINWEDEGENLYFEWPFPSIPLPKISAGHGKMAHGITQQVAPQLEKRES